MPFLTHWQLLAVLWLQLPFFRTLTRLLSHTLPPIFRQVASSTPTAAPAAAARTGRLRSPRPLRPDRDETAPTSATRQ